MRFGVYSNGVQLEATDHEPAARAAFKAAKGNAVLRTNGLKCQVLDSKVSRNRLEQVASYKG